MKLEGICGDIRANRGPTFSENKFDATTTKFFVRIGREWSLL